MSRMIASLLLAGALVFTTTPSNAEDTIPPVTFPTIPAQAQSASDFVPSGWVVEMEILGDLNRDGVPDLVLLLHLTDPGNLIAGDKRGTWQLDTNPRILLVAFADKATDSLKLALADHTLIRRHTEPRFSDPLGDITLVSGTLRVGVGSWASSGSWSISNRKFTFRHQDGCFKLIGYDAMEHQRNTGKTSKISVNYLSKKAKRSWGYSDSDDDAMNDTWTSLEAADLLCLEEIGDGLDFAGPAISASSKPATSY